MTFMSEAQAQADKIKARRQAERNAPIAVGDTVRIGRGQKLWHVESFWGEGLARLAPVEGYSHTSAHVCSLVLVAKAGAS